MYLKSFLWTRLNEPFSNDWLLLLRNTSYCIRQTYINFFKNYLMYYTCYMMQRKSSTCYFDEKIFTISHQLPNSVNQKVERRRIFLHFNHTKSLIEFDKFEFILNFAIFLVKSRVNWTRLMSNYGNWELSTHHVNNPNINDDALYCQEQLIELTIQHCFEEI